MPILHNDAKTKLLRMCRKCCLVLAQHNLLGPLLLHKGVPTTRWSGASQANMLVHFMKLLWSIKTQGSTFFVSFSNYL